MVNKKGNRELVYMVKVEETRLIPNYDRVEHVRVEGWWIVCKLGQFKPGDYAIYFEIDSRVPEEEPFMFLEKKNFKIKTQKMCKVYSQGLLMAVEDFTSLENPPAWALSMQKRIAEGTDVTHEFLTEVIGVKYADEEDNKRKANPVDKYKKMAQRNPSIFKRPWAKWMMKRQWGRDIMFFLFGKKKDKASNGWPVGRFLGVSKTDQERVENMTWVLEDKTPFIVTEKCDGSSATYILERIKRNNYEFYVCSRNVRMVHEDQECFYGQKNYYWEAAIKYDIENKMRKYLEDNPGINWVCWQGEICAPGIQKNPHGLKDTHLFCFHWTDSRNGRIDIRVAKALWKEREMEVVPIYGIITLPDDFEEFKLKADGFYSPECCEGATNKAREGFVYYKADDPTFSFKNVSRKYLLKH